MTAQAYAPAGLEETKLLRPETIAEACRMLREAKSAGSAAVVLAGGTDWIVDRHLSPIEKAKPVGIVIDVSSVAELQTIHEDESDDHGHLVLGGGVTYWQLRSNPTVSRRIPMLGQMARDVGAVQIQTRGTLAGNIASASPAADGVAALMALDGVVTLAKEGSERQVPLDAFFTGYRQTVLEDDELITAIKVRVPSAGARVTWRKVGTRQAQSISKVALAAVVESDENTILRARFGMASVAATTHPLPGVRKYLEGRKWTDIHPEDVAIMIDREIKPIDDVRSTGEYRLHVAKTLVTRAVLGDGEG